MSEKKKGILIPERYKPVLGAFIFFVVMLSAFIASSPDVFLSIGIYPSLNLIKKTSNSYKFYLT